MHQRADAGGRFSLCVPRDARQATVWAEFGHSLSRRGTMIAVAPASLHVVVVDDTGALTIPGAMVLLRHNRFGRRPKTFPAEGSSRWAPVPSHSQGRAAKLPVGGVGLRVQPGGLRDPASRTPSRLADFVTCPAFATSIR